MASFVYNHYKSDKVFDLAESQKQWYDYLQEKEFHDDLTKTLKSEANSYRKELQRNAELAGKDMNALRQEFSQASEQQLEAIHEQTKAITESADMICGTLDEGFGEVTGKLDDISAMLDWRLSAVEDQLRISNMLLENITLLLRVPDFQKERQYYIEQGFKHYKNATLDSDLYEDALSNLLEAEKRETTDYVVLHRLGMIHLYADKKGILNLAKAEEYFRRAAKYAIVESNPDAQQTLNFLAGDARQSLSAQATTPEAAKAVAAKAYFQAGVACYAQGKFAEAVELCSKAYSLLPSFLEAGFLQAKSLAILGNGKKSADILHDLIKAERFYAIKTISDADLTIKPEVQSMLQELQIDAISQAKERFKRISGALISDTLKLNKKINKLLKENTYFGALRALDELTMKRSWSFEGISKEAYKRYLYKRNETIDSVNLQNEYPPKIQIYSVEEYYVLQKFAQKRDKQNEKQNQQIKKVEKQKIGDRHRQIQINDLLFRAQDAENKQNQKWFFKDYKQAITLYEQAVALGSNEAKQKLESLKKRLGLA